MMNYIQQQLLESCKEFLRQLANSRILFIPELHKKDILDLPVWEE